LDLGPSGRGFKGQCHKIFNFRFFLESVSPKPNGGKFATGINDMGDKFATGVFYTSGKFATSINDIGGVPSLSCGYLRKFSEVQNGPSGILMGFGETDSWKKNLKSKILWHCPLTTNIMFCDKRK
jgi:hypothetical protein